MESTKAIYVFGGTPIRLSSSDAWECGLAWWLSLADAGFKLKMEKGEEERKFVRNDQARQEARHSILPLWGGSFGGWCFVGLVVSAESVFCGGGEF